MPDSLDHAHDEYSGPHTAPPAETDGSSAKASPIRFRILRATAVLPAMFTLLNGMAGFAAIHFAAKDGFGTPLDDAAISNLQIGALLLFVAMLCDMLDGRVARMTRSTSEFGAQLDSLCDMISFGVAPALLTLRTSIAILREQIDYLPIERIVWCAAAVYVSCAALRLARFNVETEQDESAHMDFRGLPTPGAAACLATMLLLLCDLLERSAVRSWLNTDVLQITMSILLPTIMLAVGLLMVSRIRYPHIVNQYIRGKRPFSYLVKLLLFGLGMVLAPAIAAAVVTLLYVAGSPIRAGWRLIRARSVA